MSSEVPTSFGIAFFFLQCYLTGTTSSPFSSTFPVVLLQNEEVFSVLVSCGNNPKQAGFLPSMSEP